MLVIYLYFNQHKTYAEIAEIEKEKCHSLIYTLSYRKKNKQDDKKYKKTNNSKKRYLPKYTNYFLKLRNLYNSLSH
jgi:hypothetical protein